MPKYVVIVEDEQTEEDYNEEPKFIWPGYGKKICVEAVWIGAAGVVVGVCWIVCQQLVTPAATVISVYAALQGIIRGVFRQ